MKTKFGAGKILSVVIPAIIAIVGLVFSFVFGIVGMGETKKSVVVTYDTYVMLNDSVKEEIVDYCNDLFPNATVSVSSSSSNGEIIIEGSDVTDRAEEMQKELTNRYPDGSYFVSYHETEVEEPTTYVWRMVIAGASLVVIAFVYTAIRYRVSQAFAQLICGVSAPILTIATVALTRLSVGEPIFVAAFLAMLVTYVASYAFLSNARKQFKTLDVPAAEAVATVMKETNKKVWVAYVAIALIGILVAFISSISVAVCYVIAAVAGFVLHRFTFPAVLTFIKTSTDEKDKAKEHYTNK